MLAAEKQRGAPVTTRILGVVQGGANVDRLGDRTAADRVLCGWADAWPHAHVVGKQGVGKQLGVVDRDRDGREELN